MVARVLIIAGSDSGGGAGIQADLKTVMALGGYGTTAITALTAQNTRGVSGVQVVSPSFLKKQISAIYDDIGAEAVKIGMLPNQDLVDVVTGWVSNVPSVPSVFDPVMVATSGAVLVEPKSREAFSKTLLKDVTLITPNIPEAELLTGRRIDDVADMIAAAKTLRQRGAKSVLVKGGHLRGERIVDVLATEDGIKTFEDTRIESSATHGTGCTLSTAIAVSLGQGQALIAAIERARQYVRAAIASAEPIGTGAARPMNHAHNLAAALKVTQ